MPRTLAPILAKLHAPAIMHPSDLTYASAVDLAAMIRARTISPVELMRATLDRIERSQPVLNAFITVAADLAMRTAYESEAAVMRGDPLGNLHGVPLAVKDSGADRRTAHHVGVADLQGPCA